MRTTASRQSRTNRSVPDSPEIYQTTEHIRCKMGTLTSLEVWHARVLLDAGLVDEIVIHDDLAVRVRQVVALLRRFRSVLAGLAFTVAGAAFDVLTLEVVDLVDDDAENTTGDVDIRRNTQSIELVLGIGDSASFLSLRLVLDFLRHIRACLLLQPLVKRCLLVIANRPCELAVHFISILEALKGVLTGKHLVGLLEIGESDEWASVSQSPLPDA
jgi:hypothetical protein